MALGPTIKITPSVTKVTRETTSHHQKNPGIQPDIANLWIIN
jgi:hypothetical protein